MENSKDKIKTPSREAIGQTKQDNLRKAGQRMPDEKVKKNLGSQDAPHKFGQNVHGGFNKSKQK